MRHVNLEVRCATSTVKNSPSLQEHTCILRCERLTRTAQTSLNALAGCLDYCGAAPSKILWLTFTRWREKMTSKAESVLVTKCQSSSTLQQSKSPVSYTHRGIADIMTETVSPMKVVQAGEVYSRLQLNMVDLQEACAKANQANVHFACRAATSRSSLPRRHCWRWRHQLWIRRGTMESLLPT